MMADFARSSRVAGLFYLAFFVTADAHRAAAEDKFLKLPKIDLDQFQKNFDRSLSDSLQTKKFRKDDGVTTIPNGQCCGDVRSIGSAPDICEINPKLPQCENKT